MAVLEWVEKHRGEPMRPDIPHVTSTQVDRAVSELLLMNAITGISVPHRRDDPAHWQPTGLTTRGRTLLAQHRPLAETPWWRQWLKR